MIVYLSGKMTGDSGYCEKFAAGEALLRLMGHEVINPVKLAEVLPSSIYTDMENEPLYGRRYSQIMFLDFRLITMSDAVAFLPGSETSRGACLEYREALATGKKIIFLGGALNECGHG